MKKQTLLKSTLCLLMAMLCNVSWAQTVVGALGNPTTTLTDGNYVLMAKSSKNNGNAGPVFFNTTASGRKYQYDTNSPLGVGDAVLSKYVWTIDETTDENGVQHITITNYDDNTKFFPADAEKNKNFSGSTKASLKPEVKNIGGVDYIVLTLDDSNIGYIHANQDGNNPNLSYWNSYGEDGTCVKFTFHPVVELSELSRSFYTSQAPNDMTWRENTTWYFIQFPNSDSYHTGGYLAAEGSGFISSNGYSDNVSNGKLLITQTEKPIKSSALWCIVGDETNGYKFYNKMNPKLVVGTASDGTAHLYLASETKNGVSYAYDYAPSGSGTHSGCATFRVKGTTKYWNNYDGGGNPDYLSVWDHSNALSDNGSAIRLTQVTEHELAEMAAKLPVASTATEKRYYTIKNQRSADYATYVDDAAQIKHQARDAESAAQMWYFTADGNGYRMHNLATTNKYKTTSSFTADGAKVWVKENPYCAGFVCVTTTENLGSNCWDSQGDNKIGTWNPSATDYEGTSWMLEEVLPTATLPLAKLDAKLHVDDNANILGELIGQAYYIIGEVKVYDAVAVKEAIEAAESIEAVTAIKESFTVNNGVNITSKDQLVSGGVYTFVTSRGWVGANDGDNAIGTVKTSVTPAASHNNPMFQWALYQSNNGNYYLYNLGKKKFLGVPSENNGPIPFVDTPTGKNLTFKDNGHANYPIMFSTNNRHAVSQNANAGLFAWEGGWTNMNDDGSNHKVTLVSELPEATLQEIAAKVEAYDRSMPIKVEVEGWTETNPNTHFGNATATTGTNVSSTKLLTAHMAGGNMAYSNIGDVVTFTREYRGFEFQGYYAGEQSLGKSFTITEELASSITAENPLVAKFTTTDDVTLWYDDDPFSYRIPAIGKTTTGRLIAVSDYRYSLDDIGRYNYGDATPGIDLVIRMSDDNGKTWGPTKTIAKGSCVRNTNDCAYGDAAIAVVGQKVLVMGAAGDVMFGNGSATAHNRTVRIFSEDNGATWTAPQDISETLFIGENATIKNGYTAFFGSGKLAVDENYNNTGVARIYGAMLIKKEGCNNAIYVIYTDDFGVTWSILGGSQTHITANDEPKVEILPSGQILLSVRRGGGRQFNVFTYSDKATNAGSWNSNVNGCGNGGSNTCNGEIYVVDAKKANGDAVKLLLQSQPKGGSGLYDRRDVTIWYKEITNAAYTSSEIAGNWIQGMQVSTQQSSYSTMVLQNDGKIAFFFEEAPCYGDDQAKGYCMVYTPLTIEGITKGKYFSPTTDLNATQTISVVLTDAQGNEYRDQVESTVAGVAAALATKYPFITMGDNANLSMENGAYAYTNTVTLPFKVSNEETTVWHNIYWPANTNENGYPVYLSASAADDQYVPKVTESNVYGNSSYNTLDHADKISWAVYNVGNGFTFKFKNKLTGKFIQVTNVASGNAQNVKYVDEADATAFEIVKKTGNYHGDYTLKAVINGSTGYLCSTSATGYHYATHYNGNGHQGAWVKFAEAPDFAALIADINGMLSTIGTSLGQYNVTEANAEALEAAKEAMQNSGSVKLNTLNSYKTLLEGATLNMPQNGQYMRVAYDYGGNAGKLYMQSAASNVKGLEFTAATDAASIWVYYDDALYSYTAGQCLREHGNDRGLQAVGGKTTATFRPSGRAKGKYTLQCGSYVHANTSNGKYYTDHCGSDGCAQHDLILEEVTELPVAVSAAGYATFIAPVALEIPDSVKAYIGALNADSTWLTLTEVEGGVIPANTGVVLESQFKEGEKKFAKNFSFTITEDVTPIASDLKGSTAAKVNDKKNEAQIPYYTLQSDGNGGVVFKQFNGDNLAGSKAYLDFSANPTAAQSISIRFEGTTDIEMMESTVNSQPSTAIYDLLGRRVETMTKGGIYIVNGKKVVK